MNVEEQRFKSRRVKYLINKGMYLQEAQRIADKEVIQRRKLAKRLEGRPARRDNPDFEICDHYDE